MIVNAHRGLQTRKWILIFLTSLLFLSCTKPGTVTPVPIPTDPEPPGTNPPVTPPGPVNPGNLGPADFLYGSNMGYYPGWSDQQLAEILIGNPTRNLIGAGVNSLRPAMYDHFVTQWGYGIRTEAFQIYQQLGAKNNTIFLNGPSEAHRDKTKYCNGVESQSFANLYEPIWLAGGQVNPNNYYANYVYQVVKTYGPFVKYWEVWNEPDYTNNWNATQTWAQVNPNPCDLTTFYAPIQNYVRMLRITSEVVKALDPTDQVCVGGLGYAGFLDAVMRNTDNPDNGKVGGDFTKKGGAWFDCVSYHVYPMYDLTTNKNSDAAAQTLVNHKKEFEAVLQKYNADPKTFIVTETNIPRKALQGYIGSDEAQRNFLIKAAVISQQSNISGLYIYGPSESETEAQATDPYKMMGFYQPIVSGPYNVTPNSGASAWRTVSSHLKNRRFSAAATTGLQLPNNVDGGAFYSETEKNYMYVLWAKTSGNVEAATASYSFPTSLGISAPTLFSWDGKSVKGAATITLSGSPVFIQP